MNRTHRLPLSAALLLAAAVLSGASSCGDTRKIPVSERLMLARNYYDGGKFQEAWDVYMALIDDGEEGDDLKLGVANAARELGNQKYNEAQVAFQKQDLATAKARADEGLSFHNLSGGNFMELLKEHPDHAAALYGLGVLYLNRGHSPFTPFPYNPADPEQKKAAAHDLDEGVRSFRRVLEIQPDSLAAHKYLGMALIRVHDDELRRENVEEALRHLRTYFKEMSEGRKTVEAWPAERPDQKKARDAALAKFDREIIEIHDLITEAEQVERELK